MIDPKNELRKVMQGRSQELVAQELGISQAQLSYLLTGKRTPSEELLAKLGLGMRVKREYFRLRAAGSVGKDRRRNGAARNSP